MEKILKDPEKIQKNHYFFRIFEMQLKPIVYKKSQDKQNYFTLNVNKFNPDVK